MKKKYLIIGGIVLTIVIVLLVILLSKPKYVVKASRVDDRSPDRVLKVYKNDEEIEFKRIELLDGRFLCDTYNSAVYFGNLKDIKELRVTLNDKSKVVAQLIEDEVK